MKRTPKHRDLMREFTRSILFCGIVFLLVFIIKVYIRWLNTSNTFHVRRVEIEGNDLLSDNRIESMLNLKDKSTIWEIDLLTAEKTIESVGYVENAVIIRRLPDVIKVKIEEKNPIALLNIKNTLYCLDSEGLILPSEPGKMYDLPVLSGPFKGDVQIGQQIGGYWVPKGLRILRRIRYDCPDLFSEISEIIFGKKSGILMTTCHYGISVYIGEDMSLWKIRCFDAIFRELIHQNELSKTEYIDLRYQGRIFVGRRQ